MRDAYIVTSLRTPGCKRLKGAFKDTRPEDLLACVLNAVVEQTPGLEKKEIDDVLIGCSIPEAEQGLNIGRIAGQMAGFPVSVPGATINRFCASGLEAIALAALKVMSGWADAAIGGGIESMTYVPMGGSIPRPHPVFSKEQADHYMSMGLTAETVASRYQVTREAQDEFAFHSHRKAAQARAEGRFSEIIPTPATRFSIQEDGTYTRQTVIQEHDDGIREDTTLEGLAKLRPVFAANGTVTAGNASQMTDGAAATILISEDKLKQLNLTPIAVFRGYTTVGCRPDEMGIGPALAIPALLKQAGKRIEDVGLFEINEAFASQALYCLRELNIDPDIVNVNGGAIALGHPLGCTGAKLCATLLANMSARNVSLGIESMCIGGGMGAAALFERCN